MATFINPTDTGFGIQLEKVEQQRSISLPSENKKGLESNFPNPFYNLAEWLIC
jgi:hypothetical protein